MALNLCVTLASVGWLHPSKFASFFNWVLKSPQLLISLRNAARNYSILRQQPLYYTLGPGLPLVRCDRSISVYVQYAFCSMYQKLEHNRWRRCCFLHDIPRHIRFPARVGIVLFSPMDRSWHAALQDANLFVKTFKCPHTLAFEQGTSIGFEHLSGLFHLRSVDATQPRKHLGCGLALNSVNNSRFSGCRSSCPAEGALAYLRRILLLMSVLQVREAMYFLPWVSYL